MIPFVAKVSVRDHRNRNYRFWIPLVFVWLLLAPVALLLLPLMFIVCLAASVSPFEGLSISWQILSALKGTEIDLDRGPGSVSIYLF